MIEKIRHLLKHSLVYSLSNVAAKAAGVVLLPLYTKFLTVTQFGELGLVTITISLISQILFLGQGHSLVRYNNSIQYRERKGSIFFTLSLFCLCVSLAFLIVSELFLRPFAGLFNKPGMYYFYLRISIYIVALLNINNLFLNKLRADERSVFYTVIGIAKLALSLGLTIYYLAFLHSGIEGVLYPQLAGEILNLLMILPPMVKEMKFRIRWDVIPDSLKFGVPLVFSALAMTLLNVSDRYVLKYYTSYSTLGLYELAYRVAGVLNMIVVIPVSLTFLPVTFNLYGKPGDKRYYSKLLTYITFGLIWAGLGISAYSYEIIRIFALNKAYLNAYRVVPWITFAYAVSGMNLVATLGMYLTGKTKFIALATIFAAAINLGLNFLFVPRYGMTAAAINTLVAFIFLYFYSYFESQKQYRIPFENRRVLLIVSTGVLLYMLCSVFNGSSYFVSFPVKAILFFSFPFLLYPLGVYEAGEVLSFKKNWRSWKNPLKWAGNIGRLISKEENK